MVLVGYRHSSAGLVELCREPIDSSTQLMESIFGSALHYNYSMDVTTQFIIGQYALRQFNEVVVYRVNPIK